jgi:hypothetical protein
MLDAITDYDDNCNWTSQYSPLLITNEIKHKLKSAVLTMILGNDLRKSG